MTKTTARGGLALAIPLALAACTASPKSPQPADLSRWLRIGTTPWTVEAAEASVGPSDAVGFLVSPRSYTDFRLRVEFWVEDDTNSGVFVRCLKPRTVPDLNPDDCYEVNIWDNHPNQDFRTGSIVKLATPVVIVDTLDRWNQLEIEARGDTLAVRVNGAQTAVLKTATRTSGYVGLQYAGKNRLRFRNLIIDSR